MAETFSRRINIYIDSGQAGAAYDKLLVKQKALTADIKKYTDAGKEVPVKLTKQLEGVTKALDIQQKKVTGQLSPALKDLRDTYNKLNSELSRMSKEDAGFAEKAAQVQQADAALKKHLASVKNADTGWKDMLKSAGGIAVGVAAGGIVTAGLEKITSFIPNLISGAAKIADEFADIQKTTGLTVKEVRELNKELAKINTRTSMSDLRAIAAVGGQFNVAKNQLVDFVREVDRVNVALGDEFGGGAENVATQVSTLRNILTDMKSDNIATDILHIGNAINQLGNEGLATAPVVADFANRIGGVGIPLGLSSAQVLGLSATMQELGINAERGGTAIGKILQKITTDTKGFAEVAGMDVKDFTELVNKDLYGAFIKVIEGSTKAGGSATAMGELLKDASLTGSGASEVFLKLASNTDLAAQKIKSAGSALGSTDSIMQEFNSKNENFAGWWEKLQKNLNKRLNFGGIADSLLPVTKALVKFTDTTKTAAQAMAEEQTQMLQAEQRILQYNVGQEKRTALIKELQERYPQYLGYLDAETASNEDLKKAIELTNTAIINKIVLQTLDEEQMEKAADAAEARLALDREEVKLADMLGRLKQQAANDERLMQLEGMELAEQARRLLSRDAKERIQLNGVSSVSLGWLADVYERYNDKLRESKLLEIDANALLKEKDEVAKRLAASMANGPVMSQEIVITANRTDKTKESDEDKKAREKYLKDQADFLERLKQLEFEAYLARLSDNDREVEAARVKYVKLKEEAKKYGVDIDRINRLQGAEFARLTQEQLGKEYDAAYKLALKNSQNFYRQQEFDLKQSFADRIITEQQYEFQSRFLAVQAAEDKAEIARKFVGVSKEASDAAAEADMAANQASLDFYIWCQQQKDALAAKAAAEAKKKLDKEKKEWYDTYADINQVVQFGVQGLVSIWQQASQIQAELDEADYNRSKKTNERKLRNIEDMYNRGRISRIQFERETKRLNDKQDKEDREYKRKAFERQKQMQIGQVWMNAAMGIGGLLSQYASGFPGTLPIFFAMSALTLGLAGAQTGIIEQQQAPMYRDGITSIQGPSHENGGIDLVVNGKKIGEMEGGESIMSKDASDYNAPLLKMLNKNPKALSMTRNMENIQYYRNGFVPSDSTGNAPTQYSSNTTMDNRQMLGMLQTLIDETKKNNAKKVNFVQYDYDQFGERNDFLYTRNSID